MYPGYRTCTGTKINKNREKHEDLDFFLLPVPMVLEHGLSHLSSSRAQVFLPVTSTCRFFLSFLLFLEFLCFLCQQHFLAG